MKRSSRVISGGAGCFLDAPTYPTHTHSVETDLDRSPANCGSMSLEYAATCDYLDAETRKQAADMLAGWQAPAIDSPDVQAWILQVLGYFHDCYRGAGEEAECWNVSNLEIWGSNWYEPRLQAGIYPRPITDHAGVHLIRKFYPEFIPTAANWAEAHWGTK